jgi:hypothetical protein
MKAYGSNIANPSVRCMSLDLPAPQFSSVIIADRKAAGLLRGEQPRRVSGSLLRAATSTDVSK